MSCRIALQRVTSGQRNTFFKYKNNTSAQYAWPKRCNRLDLASGGHNTCIIALDAENTCMLVQGVGFLGNSSGYHWIPETFCVTSKFTISENALLFCL